MVKLVARDKTVVLMMAGDACGKRYGDSSDEGCWEACDRDMYKKGHGFSLKGCVEGSSNRKGDFWR